MDNVSGWEIRRASSCLRVLTENVEGRRHAGQRESCRGIHSDAGELAAVSYAIRTRNMQIRAVLVPSSRVAYPLAFQLPVVGDAGAVRHLAL